MARLEQYFTELNFNAHFAIGWKIDETLFDSSAEERDSTLQHRVQICPTPSGTVREMWAPWGEGGGS